MKMLRDFAYNPDLNVLLAALVRFNVDLPKDIAVVRFEVITPDSFMWRLLIGDGVYYLYAEDYIPSLGHVKSIFNKYLEDENWQFIKPRNVIDFEDASPVRTAAVYEKAEDSDEIMQCAIDSGHDLVFLVRATDRPDDAQFSDTAPRGFTLSK